MNIENIKKDILKLDLSKQNLIQTSLNSLVLFKSKYKYTECIYINVNNHRANIKYDKVFDNKYLNLPIERLLISEVDTNEEMYLIRHIKDIISTMEFI